MAWARSAHDEVKIARKIGRQIADHGVSRDEGNFTYSRSRDEVAVAGILAARTDRHFGGFDGNFLIDRQYSG